MTAAAVTAAAVTTADVTTAAMERTMKAAMEAIMEACMEAIVVAFVKAIMEALMPEIIAVMEFAEAITEEDGPSREEGWTEAPGICPVIVLVRVRIGVNRRRGKSINLRR